MLKVSPGVPFPKAVQSFCAAAETDSMFALLLFLMPRIHTQGDQVEQMPRYLVTQAKPTSYKKAAGESLCWLMRPDLKPQSDKPDLSSPRKNQVTGKQEGNAFLNTACATML